MILVRCFVRSLCLSLSFSFRGSFSSACALSRARGSRSCVTVNHQNPSAVLVGAHFRKCFQNINAELNPKYVGGERRRCCARTENETNDERERSGITLQLLLSPSVSVCLRSPGACSRDLAKLQVRPRPAANFGFIRHATASLIRAAF